MSIAALLQAAEYLERRDRESEHGYASPFPLPEDHMDLVRRYPYRPLKSWKTSNDGNLKNKNANHGLNGPNITRSSHNELEKSRRAHLRHCLERLKGMVPLGPESSRHTTLGLLMNAKALIKALEEKDKKSQQTKNQLFQEQRHLQSELRTLMQQQGYSDREINTALQLARERSTSESSTSTASSTSNVSEMEVDILSYSDVTSDSDDYSSIHSSNSDGGFAVHTKRATPDKNIS